MLRGVVDDGVDGLLAVLRGYTIFWLLVVVVCLVVDDGVGLVGVGVVVVVVVGVVDVVVAHKFVVVGVEGV